MKIGDILTKEDIKKLRLEPTGRTYGTGKPTLRYYEDKNNWYLLREGGDEFQVKAYGEKTKK